MEKEKICYSKALAKIRSLPDHPVVHLNPYVEEILHVMSDSDAMEVC